MTPRAAARRTAPAGAVPLFVDPATLDTADVVPVRAAGGPVTFDAWRVYLGNTPARPKPVTRTQYEAQDSRQRARYDQARVGYHRGLADIETPAMVFCHRQMTSRVDGNEVCPPTARTGVVVNGLPNNGKSTIMLRWGKKFELAERKRLGVESDARTPEGGLFLPVIHVILGDGDGPKGLCRKIMRFFQAPFAGTWDQGELTARIHRLTVGCGTRVLLIDQMQNLRMSNRSHQQTAAHIKELMDVLPVSIIGAGVNMDETGFFKEGRSRTEEELAQIGSRFGRVDVGPMDRSTADGRREFHSLLKTVETRLVLLASRDGDLLALADVIYDRTGGVIGEVMDLLRRGANEAIGAEERVTDAVLRRVVLSHRAEARGRREPTVDIEREAILDAAAASAQKSARAVGRAQARERQTPRKAR